MTVSLRESLLFFFDLIDLAITALKSTVTGLATAVHTTYKNILLGPRITTFISSQNPILHLHKKIS